MSGAKPYRSRRPWERKGEIGTGAPPKSPTADWRIFTRERRGAAEYVTLNVYAGASPVMVVIRGEQYCCTVGRCVRARRTPLHVSDDSYAGCIHTQFVRAETRGYHVPPLDAPPPETRDDAEEDTESEDARDAEIERARADDGTEHAPPF